MLLPVFPAGVGVDGVFTPGQTAQGGVDLVEQSDLPVQGTQHQALFLFLGGLVRFIRFAHGGTIRLKGKSPDPGAEIHRARQGIAKARDRH